jgi:hypothetical protein
LHKPHKPNIRNTLEQKFSAAADCSAALHGCLVALHLPARKDFRKTPLKSKDFCFLNDTLDEVFLIRFSHFGYATILGG